MTSGCSPIPAYMDAGNYPEYLFLSTARESLSSPPANSSNAPPFPPQGMPVLDGGWSDPRSLDIPAQVDAEVSILVGCAAPSYPLIPMFRLTPLVSDLHYILLLSPSTKQLRHPTLKSPSLPVISTTRTHRLYILRKRTPCTKQRSPRYVRFLNPPETIDLTQ